MATVEQRVNDLAFYNFKPRVDQPERYDQQTAFMDSDLPGVTLLLGGNGSGTTTCGLAKAVRFMMRQPAPRKDTPFWILAKNYEQVCNTCWKEKLHQQGHLHPNDIDWERIQWYRPNMDWPYKVPLKPRPDDPDKNWMICFKSYESGRGAMMGESIGGFLFVEQFPWGILEEVLRGCREYAFTGNKLAEFTPVDPTLSLELRHMETKNKIPEGWAVFRANTRCAMEAGNVTKQWYDLFFGMLPEASRKVRESGLWGSFEGAVFPEWNPLIHTTPDGWRIPPGWHHRRSIDFGYSADHPFVCFDDKTEVLTEHGWKFFRDIGNEKVASVSMNSHRLCWETPVHKIVKDWNGDMIYSEPKREGVGFCVTPNHEMVVAHMKNHQWRKKTADHLPKGGAYFPTRYLAEESRDDSADEFIVPHVRRCQAKKTTKGAFAALVGLIISEGNVNYKPNCLVKVVQKKFVSEVREIIAATGWNFGEWKNPKTDVVEFTIQSRSLVNFLVESGIGTQSKNKRIPRFIFSWGEECLNNLLRALMLGDGLSNFMDASGRRLQSESYYTTSPGLADDMQELASRLGRPSKIAITRNTGANKESTLFTIRFVGSRGAKINHKKIHRRHYSGKVYCLTVPSGTLIVRRNNGIPLVCGNCLWGMFDGRGRCVIYDEYWSNDTSMGVIEHWKIISDRYPWPLEINPYYGTTYVDHDLDAIRTLQKINEWTNGDYDPPSMQMARKDVHEGIEIIHMMLKPSLFIDPMNPEPRLLVHADNCPHLCEEFLTYHYPEKLMEGVNAQAPKPDPVKFMDDAMDACRYLVFSELSMTGGTIETIARQHSAGSVQIHSEKFDQPQKRSNRKKWR